MNEAMSKLSSLNRFSAHSDLARLETMLTEFDAFDFLGVSTSEEIHSRILAWLLNPRENHSVGDFFLTRFLLETKSGTSEQIHAIDWSETLIQRECAQRRR